MANDKKEKLEGKTTRIQIKMKNEMKQMTRCKDKNWRRALKSKEEEMESEHQLEAVSQRPRLLGLGGDSTPCTLCPGDKSAGNVRGQLITPTQLLTSVASRVIRAGEKTYWLP